MGFPPVVLFTIGYEKASQADVLSALKAAEVTLLVDVRDRPQSRRAGFSKRLLSASTEAAGIRYLHLKALGTPPEGREAHRQGDRDRFWQIVERQLATPEAQAALADLTEMVARDRVCLICYEADWRLCHRRRVAELLARPDLEVRHLHPEPSFG